MAARLKVFVTTDGLTDFVVAASSRPKALAAWGAHQDLFKTGLARETDDPVLSDAARAVPGEVLRRPAGSRAELAKLKPAKRRKPTATPAADPEPASKGPTKAQLRDVARLEARLQAAQARHAKAIAELDRRRDEIERAYGVERSDLQAALTEARRALG